MSAIAGFVHPTSGSIRFGARDITQLPAHRRDIGMVFQDYALFPDKSVFDNVAYGLRARKYKGAEISAKVKAALERVGLGHLSNRPPAALSGGQRQRVALARALVIEPQVLLMDEPLSNLDAKLRIQIRETISHLQKEVGITTVFVTHDQDEALAMSDFIGVMNSGRLDQVGSPKEIYNRPASAYVADFVGSANLIKVELDEGQLNMGSLNFDLAGKKLTGVADKIPTQRAATLVARPEDIKLSRDPGSASITGGILQRQYLGGKTKYKVQLDQHQTVWVDASGPDHDTFAIGETAFLEFQPSKSRILV